MPRFSQLYYWYYTTQQGTIMLENKKKISYKAVQEEFLNTKSENDIVASHFIYKNGTFHQLNTPLRHGGGSAFLI